MKPNKPKPCKMWCVYTPQNEPFPGAVAYTDFHAWDKFGVGVKPQKEWEKLGYRCLRVTVTPEGRGR